MSFFSLPPNYKFHGSDLLCSWYSLLLPSAVWLCCYLLYASTRKSVPTYNVSALGTCIKKNFGIALVRTGAQTNVVNLQRCLHIPHAMGTGIEGNFETDSLKNLIGIWKNCFLMFVFAMVYNPMTEQINIRMCVYEWRIM